MGYENEQYPIELAQDCLNKQKPNIHYAVYRMWTGDEHIEELTASSYDEAEDLAHSLQAQKKSSKQ